MQYMGSKARHSKELIPIILKDRKPGQWYVEPFVGGANIIDKVDGNRIGNDSHPHLIALLDALSKGWLPPELVTEEDYKEARLNKHDVTPLIGHIGFMSFGAKWFGGYRRNEKGGNKEINEAFQSSQAFRVLSKQAVNIRGVKFVCGSYLDLEIPPQSIIYCDPPYAGTTKYATDGFDHEQFWQWCRDKANEGHTVFVSEYSAPDDWLCVWEKKTSANFDSNRDGSSERIERLFTLGKP